MKNRIIHHAGKIGARVGILFGVWWALSSTFSCSYDLSGFHSSVRTTIRPQSSMLLITRRPRRRIHSIHTHYPPKRRTWNHPTTLVSSSSSSSSSNKFTCSSSSNDDITGSSSSSISNSNSILISRRREVLNHIPRRLPLLLTTLCTTTTTPAVTWGSLSTSVAWALEPSLITTVHTDQTQAQAKTQDQDQDRVVVEYKDFVDPEGLFSIRIPSHFFAIRRRPKSTTTTTNNSKEATTTTTASATLFTAGDLRKSELVSIERFPTRRLLEDNGIQATGDLSTFSSLGDLAAVANLLRLRRDATTATTTKTTITTEPSHVVYIVPGSIVASRDDKELQFVLNANVPVQKPELLMEQYGVRQLVRVTRVKACLRSHHNNNDDDVSSSSFMWVVYASALESDFDSAHDGPLLDTAIDTFTVCT